jgi:hypothetical protein
LRAGGTGVVGNDLGLRVEAAEPLQVVDLGAVHVERESAACEFRLSCHQCS